MRTRLRGPHIMRSVIALFPGAFLDRSPSVFDPSSLAISITVLSLPESDLHLVQLPVSSLMRLTAERHFAVQRRRTSRIPVNSIAGVGGQPGIYPSTGITASTGPTIA